MFIAPSCNKNCDFLQLYAIKPAKTKFCMHLFYNSLLLLTTVNISIPLNPEAHPATYTMDTGSLSHG